MKTLALASDSAVSRMIKLVEAAQNQRSRTDYFIQHFAKYYTPGIVVYTALLYRALECLHIDQFDRNSF